MADKDQDSLVQELVSLFGESAQEAERMVRARLQTDWVHKWLRDGGKDEDYEELDLLQLLRDFRKLAEIGIPRKTSLITLLEFELCDGGYWGPNLPKPPQDFRKWGTRRRPLDLDRIEGRRSEPEFVYRVGKRRNHT